MSFISLRASVLSFSIFTYSLCLWKRTDTCEITDIWLTHKSDFRLSHCYFPFTSSLTLICSSFIFLRISASATFLLCTFLLWKPVRYSLIWGESNSTSDKTEQSLEVKFSLVRLENIYFKVTEQIHKIIYIKLCVRVSRKNNNTDCCTNVLKLWS